MSQRRVPPLLLLPPSEGKAEGGRPSPWSPDLGTWGTALEAARLDVVDALRAADGGDQRLLGVSGAHLERARHANLALLGAPTLPAWRRYTGVVWEHLDPVSLPAVTRRRIAVVSGLMGLVRADDPTPDYRLKLGARPASLGLLSRWWQPVLTSVLERVARRNFVVDLLANEQRAAISPVVGGGATVLVLERSGAGGGHGAKAAKGGLARYLLERSDEMATDRRGPAAALERAVAAWRDDRYTAVTEPW